VDILQSATVLAKVAADAEEEGVQEQHAVFGAEVGGVFFGYIVFTFVVFLLVDFHFFEDFFKDELVS
jgi:hypothetical protein